MADTATITEPILGLDLDSEPSCHWCPQPAAWIVIYRPCGHQHLMCDRCKRAQERRQQVADEAMPPRPLGEHGCCGRKIHRAGWEPL